MAGKGGGPYPTMQRPFSVLSLLLIALVRSEDLKVTMGTSLISAKIGETVIISCYISNIDINKVLAVEWKQTFENGTEKDVYVYNNGGVTPYREGSSMDVEEIRNGNANLHLPSVQISDDGEYTCSVINTPRHALGKTALQVSVQPSVTVTPEDVTIELGTEKSVMCEVSNFYPQTVTIHWVQFNKAFPGYVTLKNGICTAEHITNNDGTFNITSHMTLSPKKADDGSSYGCVVTHRSRDRETMKNFTLTVTEREDYTGTIVGAMFGTLLCTLLTVACVLIYWMRFKKDPPTLSAITGNDELTDMSRTTLTCQIMNYRPDDITVSVCLRRCGQQEEENIYTWSSGVSTAPARLIRDGDCVILDVMEQQRLVSGAARQDERPLQLEVVPVVSRSKLSSFSCQCSLHITPSYDLDNEAELSIDVLHPALTSPISVLRVLKVTGVPPRLNYIIAPDHQTPNENVTLTCPINYFKPRHLSITWLRRDRKNKETELTTWPSVIQQQHNGKYLHHVKANAHGDFSYSYLSVLTFSPTVYEDDGVIYICRTFHHATEEDAEEELTMSLIAFPQFDEIQKKQEVIYIGEELNLACRIHSFYPTGIRVAWYMEGGDLPLPSITSDPLQEPSSGLYHVTTTVSYTPTVKDQNKIFICEVQHETAKARYVTWTLSELFSISHVGEIRSDCAEPEIGQLMTLSCAVSNMYPEPADVQWYHGSNKLSHSLQSIKISREESGMFSGTIELRLKAMYEHHGAPIRLQITHAAKITSKEFIMKLKGLPVLGEIISDPRIGEYGRSMTLYCHVTGCDLRDISKVAWTDGRGRAVKAQQRETRSTDLLVCTQITPTAKDYGRIYTCRVRYKNIQAFTRNVTLRLPEKPPTLSDIMVRPEMVRANQETLFQVTVSGFSPRDIQVKWYKGFQRFPPTVVTSSNQRIGGDKLCKLTNTLTYVPSQKDDNVSIRCEVTHSASKTIREKHYVLNLTGQKNEKDNVDGAPEEKLSSAISRIECLTERPHVGEEITLVGHVDGCDAETAEFSWYKETFPIDGEIDNKQVGSGCTSTITFTAEDSDTDCTIRLEVIYNYQTMEEAYNLRLV